MTHQSVSGHAVARKAPFKTRKDFADFFGVMTKILPNKSSSKNDLSVNFPF